MTIPVVRNPIPHLAMMAAILCAMGASVGCAPKMLRLENEVLQHQNAALREQLDDCGQTIPRDDFAPAVTLEVIEDYLQRAGLPQGERSTETIILIPIETQNTDFGVLFQLFEEQKILYIATHHYLRIEAAASPQAMVLMLTRLATLNYELLLGKFQLNPSSGAISLSAEIQLHDGMGYQTFHSTVNNLIQTADTSYPTLLRAAQGQGI